MHRSAGIRSIALAFPEQVRTNDHWRRLHPELVRRAEEKGLAKIFQAEGSTPESRIFDEEMAPFLSDPFRGTVERRALAPGETALGLELRAAQAALAAARLSPQEVDLLLVNSVRPDEIIPGNAVFLARALGMRAAAWNLESMCTSSVVALQTAAALVRAGEHRHVLVVISCTYTRDASETDTFSWFLGDGAGAFVVGPAPPGQGVLGCKVLNTSETCGSFYYDFVSAPEGTQRIHLNAGPGAGRAVRDTGVVYLKECSEGAMAAAGVKQSDIRFFIFNTPVAWYAPFCARVLGIPMERTINTYPRYANIGPVLTLANLYHAAAAGRIRPDDLVLLYAIGSVSTAGAAVVRWGDVALGPPPV